MLVDFILNWTYNVVYFDKKIYVLEQSRLGAIHKGRPAKTRISRPPSPLRPDKAIESHSNNK